MKRVCWIPIRTIFIENKHEKKFLSHFLVEFKWIDCQVWWWWNYHVKTISSHTLAFIIFMYWIGVFELWCWPISPRKSAHNKISEWFNKIQFAGRVASISTAERCSSSYSNRWSTIFAPGGSLLSKATKWLCHTFEISCNCEKEISKDISNFIRLWIFTKWIEWYVCLR